jgi:formylglycine-generating enzyme required for sulfatase activity
VNIGRAFYLGRYEVTQEQWQAVMGGNPSKFPGAKNPVESVSWVDCQQFLGNLNAQGPRGSFALPTEAQWEYACRAGETGLYSFGENRAALDDYAWHCGNSRNKTHPVGQKKPNAWGFYDMHGNVQEWCTDWYDAEYYAQSPLRDPTGPTSGRLRVSRGGCGTDAAWDCRAACRIFHFPEDRNPITNNVIHGARDVVIKTETQLHLLGLRVCLNPPDESLSVVPLRPQPIASQTVEAGKAH